MQPTTSPETQEPSLRDLIQQQIPEELPEETTPEHWQAAAQDLEQMLEHFPISSVVAAPATVLQYLESVAFIFAIHNRTNRPIPTSQLTQYLEKATEALGIIKSKAPLEDTEAPLLAHSLSQLTRTQGGVRGKINKTV